jgi:signal peptidase II
MIPARRIYLVALLVTLLLDQASKLYIFYVIDLAATQPIQITSFFNLILVWNRGISYGLFQQEGDLGRWLLTVFKLGAAVAMTIWAFRSNEMRLNTALGLIAGGAIGNAIDRIQFGAVLDFAHFFWGGFSWYVFNIADAAIVVGVALMMYDSFRPRGISAPEKP